VESFAFGDVARIVQRISELLGPRLEATQCSEMKAHLLQNEEFSGTGRVRLRDFYRSALHGGAWQFQESIDYLRQMGVLDESDTSQPRIIIANYLYMHADCIETSQYYANCCVNPCEGLLGELERRVQAPYATPEKIVSLVWEMRAPSGLANQTLVPALVRKLEDIASHHDGVVPLHGRLFSQWMHFVYPHECPYPHLHGTTKLMSNEEWHRETGMETWWTDSEMRSFVESSRDAPESAGCNVQDPEQGSCPLASMWVHEEELVDTVHWHTTRAAHEEQNRLASRRTSLGIRACLLLAVLISGAASMMNLIKHGRSSLGMVLGDKIGKTSSGSSILSV